MSAAGATDEDGKALALDAAIRETDFRRSPVISVGKRGINILVPYAGR